METRGKFPNCPHCSRQFTPGSYWTGANYCRGIYLLNWIHQHPGLSAWELSQLAHIPYTDTTRALLKLRDWGLLVHTVEDRQGGGQRFRYECSNNAEALQNFQAALNRFLP